MNTRSSHWRKKGFTLVETMVGAAIGSIILAALMLGSVALMRTFKAVENYSDASIDQARILDYIARDVRRARDVTVLQNRTRLELTIPDQYANAPSSKQKRVFREPTIGPADTILYNRFVNVSYFRNGKNFVREEAGVSSTLAKNISDPPVFDLNGKMLTTTITFAPTFRLNSASAPRGGTSMTNRVFLRNK